MNLLLTEEQAEFRKMLRQFVDREIAPRAAELDRTSEFPAENIRKLGDLGLMGLLTPESHGGLALPTADYVLAIEEVARGCASTALILSVHNSLVGLPIAVFGTAAQRERFLPGLNAGALLGAFALTEPAAGSDAASIRSTARRDGDDYVLDGTKVFISSGDVADLIVLFASTDRSRGGRGVSAFILERGMAGLTTGKREDKLGLRASSAVQLFLDGCHVPVANRLGDEGQGFALAKSFLAGGRLGIAAQAVGIAEAAFEAATGYLEDRRQFGQPIAEFQGMRWTFSDLRTRIDAARLLIARAAQLRDRGLPHTAESSMAKLFASETAMHVTTKAVQAFGGYGYMRDYPVERLFRDAKATEIYEGTSEIHRDIIARSIFSRQDRDAPRG